MAVQIFAEESPPENANCWQLLVKRMANCAPSLWHLELETEDHEEQTGKLVDNATQRPRLFTQIMVVTVTSPEEDMVKDAACKKGDPKTFPPHIHMIQIDGGRGIRGIEHGTVGNPDVALEDEALPAVCPRCPP